MNFAKREERVTASMNTLAFVSSVRCVRYESRHCNTLYLISDLVVGVSPQGLCLQPTRDGRKAVTAGAHAGRSFASVREGLRLGVVGFASTRALNTSNVGRARAWICRVDAHRRARSPAMCSPPSRPTCAHHRPGQLLQSGQGRHHSWPLHHAVCRDTKHLRVRAGNDRLQDEACRHDGNSAARGRWFF